MLLVPLSTRNTKQRDSLAMMVSMGQSMLPGALVYMIFPMIFLPIMGADQATWAKVMSIISCLFLPGAILQYYFTKERVSEDAAAGHEEVVSLGQQIKTCFSDKYWLYYFAILFFYQFSQNIYSVAINFYANYVMGSYNDGSTLTILNVVGQFPLGVGVFLLWPLARKYGKRWTFFVGMLLSFAAGMVMFFVSKPGNLVPVLAASFFKAIGMLPTYLFAGMMADAMDHIEWERGYRCDGFTATMSSVLMTIMAGFGTTIFNAGLRAGSANGYVAPLTGTSLTDIFAQLSDKGLTAQLAMDAYTANVDGVYTVAVNQPAGVNRWLVICVALIPAITYLIMAVFGYFNDVGEQTPQISKDIQERHRREAEARGEVYVSPEEKAAAEQIENDRIAEENRIAELKAKCEKKGLSFEEEEAKYQAKLAEAKAKAEAKAAKKAKK